MDNKVLRQAYLEHSQSFLNDYKDGQEIITPHVIYVSLDFFNKYFKFNKNLNFKIKDGTEEKDDYEFIVKELDKNPEHLWILGQFDYHSKSIDYKIIEEILTKKHIKYKKSIDDYFYTYEIL